MLFFAVTVVKMETSDTTKKPTNFGAAGCKVRYRIDKLSHYQEWDADTTIVYLTEGGIKLYVKESVEQLDMILNGANDKTVGLLYGKT